MGKLANKIADILRTTGDILKVDIQEELRDQGHVNTGKLFNSVKASVNNGTDIELNITMNDYHTYVEHGVRANRIPFGGKRKGGKRTSRYIQGLINFFKSKGKTLKDAKAAAFATANVHKREGMPTQASRRFSNNGRRLEFINESTKASRQITTTEELILDAVEIEASGILDSFETKIR
jgi:hypothetical protein